MNKRQRKKKMKPAREWLKACEPLIREQMRLMYGTPSRQWFKLKLKEDL